MTDAGGPATDLTAVELELQREVRAFLARRLPRGTFEPSLGMVGGRDPEFSRDLAAQGWVGMALPKKYGGGDRTAVERLVVVEELLRWGAPVEHHWTADRQSGPVIRDFGSETLKDFFLPRICRAEVSFCIGMSEPDAGSDLAAVRTSAAKVAGGWRLNGTKIWTSGARQSDYFIVLCRTSDEPDRHAGLSRLIVDLNTEGITINPITFLDGTADFNEVVLDDVFVDDDMLLGEAGQGWMQNTSELVYERGGPERWLSPYLIVEELVRRAAGVGASPETVQLLGAAVAMWWPLRRLSLRVARLIDAGKSPAMEAALAKDIGTRFEQRLVDALQDVVSGDLLRDDSALLEHLLHRAVLTAPSFTIRGGTTEVLRSVIAKGLRHD